jgi:aryl-alcohol dehydrogenase-like predicted oxidoreductase
MSTRRTPLIFGLAGLHRIALVSHRQRLLRQAFDVGFRSFDVAPAYGNGLGELELGEAILRRRPDVKITTKFGIPVDLYGERFRSAFTLIRVNRRYFSRGYGSEYAQRRISGPEMIASLDGSLRRLRCDYVDRLLIHEPLEPCAPELAAELTEFAERLKSQGKILSFGVCGPSDSIRRVVGATPVDIIQSPLWDLPGPSDCASERLVAYGVYRGFQRQAEPSKQVFVDYVAQLRASRPDIELILASTSRNTLAGWGKLFS